MLRPERGAPDAPWLDGSSAHVPASPAPVARQGSVRSQLQPCPSQTFPQPGGWSCELLEQATSRRAVRRRTRLGHDCVEAAPCPWLTVLPCASLPCASAEAALPAGPGVPRPFRAAPCDPGPVPGEFGPVLAKGPGQTTPVAGRLPGRHRTVQARPAAGEVLPMGRLPQSRASAVRPR